MASRTLAESEWLSKTSKSEGEGESGSERDMEEEAPRHPVPKMQGAFEESMMETMQEVPEDDFDNRYSTADSISRRKILLEQEHYERIVAGKWKQKPGEKFHPLWKLIAQISFGMHLLSQSLAKSDEEVIKILQSHVDEIDGFLERTTADFDLAHEDILERIRCLRLPLEHGDVFDTMLEDRAFRIAIVEGNEKIEHIVNRTNAAMKDALKDVQKGLDGTRELTRYLTQLQRTWLNQTEEHHAVYSAMNGNTEGWTRAFMTLQSKGSKLGYGLSELSGIISRIQTRAGIASRKNIVSFIFHYPLAEGSKTKRTSHLPVPSKANITSSPKQAQQPCRELCNTHNHHHNSQNQQSYLFQCLLRRGQRRRISTKKMECKIRDTSKQLLPNPIMIPNPDHSCTNSKKDHQAASVNHPSHHNHVAPLLLSMGPARCLHQLALLLVVVPDLFQLQMGFSLRRDNK